MSPLPNNYFRHKSIRDPLYGFVSLSETETRIIDTPVFRRLQHIKQLSHTYLVYPSSVHTRFEHSLGVAYLADKLAKQLQFTDEQREVIRLAGLLHDVGHGPFSHLFESVMERVNGKKIGHDQISMMIIKENADIAEILGDLGGKVVQLLGHQNVSGWNDPGTSRLAADVISSELDADKMDYLRRDSYHIGVQYGNFDLPRVVSTITSTSYPGEKRICVDSKGKDAIENYRLGRYLMHAQVYHHPARIAGDQMFFRAMDLAANAEGILPSNMLAVDVGSGKSRGEFLERYVQLDDRSICDLITRTSPGSMAADILRRISQRRLLKRAVDVLPDVEIEDAQIRDRVMSMQSHDLDALSSKMAGAAGLKPHDVICKRISVPVDLYHGDILVMWKGVPKKLDELSPIKAETLSADRLCIFCPDDPGALRRIRECAAGHLGIRPSKL